MQRKWWVLSAVGAGTFMSALDGSVVNSILPVIRHDMGADVATIEWVTTAFLLVVSAVLLWFGRLGDLYGHRRSYLAGLVTFVGASALCALAGDARALVAYRALQALGAAMLFANGPAILTTTFPAEQRGRALGLQATMTYLGLTAGPSIGGLLTEHFGWRSVFLINIPVGGVAIALAMAHVPRDAVGRTRERLDVWGGLLFLAGLVALLLALNRGHEWGWASARVLCLFALSAATLTAFAAVERRTAYPMLDLSLFGSRQFASSTVSAVLSFVAVSAIAFLLPFYLLQGRHLRPDQAGMLLAAQPLVMAGVAPVAGALSDRIGSRALTVIGMLVIALALGALSSIGPNTSLWVIAGCLAVAGAGSGLFSAPNNSALMGAAPRGRQGIAGGVLATCRNLGMVLGIGIAGAILATVMAEHAGSPGTAALFVAVRAGFAAAGLAALLAAGVSAAR